MRRTQEKKKMLETALPPAPTQRRFSREEFLLLAETGILRPDERVELLDGRILIMPPIGPDHEVSTTLVQDALKGAFGPGHMVRHQLSLAIGPDSLPQPDLAVVRGEAREWAKEHPTTALLVIEVARTSLAFDRKGKALAYARAGIADYWIVNLAAETVEVHRAPGDKGYRQVTTFRRGDSIKPLAARRKLKVADLLP